MHKFKKTLLITILATIITIVWYSGLYSYFNINTLKTYQNDIDIFVFQHPIVSKALFISIYITVVSLAFPIHTLMVISSGFMFGSVGGTILSVSSGTISAMIVFLSFKTYGDKLNHKSSKKFVLKLKAGFNKNAFLYTLSLRMLPIFPFFIVNMVAAILQVPIKFFLPATIIGVIPSSIIYAHLGVVIREISINSQQWHKAISYKTFLLLMVLSMASIIPILYKKILKTK